MPFVDSWENLAERLLVDSSPILTELGIVSSTNFLPNSWGEAGPDRSGDRDPRAHESPRRSGAEGIRLAMPRLGAELLIPSAQLVNTVDQSNLEDYEAGKTWIEPVEGKPELDSGEPTVK